MADSWLTHAEYLTYGYEVISEEEFPQLAAKATLQIMEATHWRAAAAKDEACIRYIWSHPEWNFNGAPMRGAYWAQRSWADNGDDIVRGAAQIAGGHAE